MSYLKYQFKYVNLLNNILIFSDKIDHNKIYGTFEFLIRQI
jgi:hypothetical protein